MDRILLTDLRAMTLVGALPHEREASQPIRVDMSLGVDLRDAGRSDELDDTVHYGLVAERVVALMTDSKPVLLERLAEQIAEVAFGFDLVEEVELTVTKLRPPIALHVESTAVTISRRRHQVEVAALRSTEAVVALGSNLGDRADYLREAIGGLGNVTARSDVYETAPVGGPGEQGPFLNMVVTVDTSLDAFAFLRRCQRLEADAMRQRVVRWGPRTLDVDVLFFGDTTMNSDDLILPHPRIDERRFVLEPLSDVAPQRCPDGWREALPPADVINVGALDQL